jgi:DNA-binding NarL/FixJ family response regulator
MTQIRIALVEDHKLTRIGLKATLNQHDAFTVVGEAENARQGLRLLQSTQPDVAIVDIGLPDMDGTELVRLLREQSQDQPSDTPPIKVVMLTMHDSEDSVLAAFAAGADSYCMKDIQMDQLIDAVQSTHAGHAWIDPAIANVVLRQVRQAGSTMGQQIAIEAVSPEYQALVENFPLTNRELEILELIVAGFSNADIAKRLGITIGTIKTHVRHILDKLYASDRTQAAVRALRLGLVS